MMRRLAGSVPGGAGSVGSALTVLSPRRIPYSWRGTSQVFYTGGAIGTTHAQPAMPGVLPGVDVLVAHGSGRGSLAVTPPAGEGWQLVDGESSAAGGNAIFSYLFWKVAALADIAGGQTWTYTGGATAWAVDIGIVRGLRRSAPIGAVSELKAGNSVGVPQNVPSITATTRTAALVAFAVHGDGNTGGVSWAAPMVVQANHSDGGSGASTTATSGNAIESPYGGVAGPTGTRSLTYTTADSNIIRLVALER